MAKQNNNKKRADLEKLIFDSGIDATCDCQSCIETREKIKKLLDEIFGKEDE